MENWKEVKELNRKVLGIGLVLAFAMLALPISVGVADSPMIEVEGTIDSILTLVTTVKEVGQNRFVFAETESTWDGGISGSTTGSQTWILHFARPAQLNINAEIFFTTATVDGKTGTMTIELNMILYRADYSASHGTWRIKDAAGGLEGLHGEGAWLAAPNRYEGKVHFSN